MRLGDLRTGGGEFLDRKEALALAALHDVPRSGLTKAGDGHKRRQKLSVLSYLGPFWLIPAITQNGDPFMKYHTEQGLGLIIFGILTSLLGNLWGWVGTVGGIICTIGAIKGIVSVLKGKREPLPVIGDLVQSVKESIAKRKNKR